MLRGAKALSTIMKKSLIVKFSLQLCKIEDSGLQALSPILLKTTLTHLDLSGNDLTLKGTTLLQSILKDSPFLYHMNISGNQLNHESALLLCEGLQFNRSLRELDLSQNELGPQGMAIFAGALKALPFLEKLYLGGNNLGDKGAESISLVIEYNTVLSVLDIQSNQIDSVGASYLARALKKNMTLQSLNVGFNPLGDKGSFLFAESIKDHPKINYLFLREINTSTDPAFSEILSHLFSNQTLKSLSIQFINHLPIETIQNLPKSLKKNSNLTYLNLEYKVWNNEIYSELNQVISRNKEIEIKKQLSYFIQNLIILSRDTINVNLISYWSRLPLDLKNHVLKFLYKDLSKNTLLNKTEVQFKGCADFILSNIEEINRRIREEENIKILEKSSFSLVPKFTFFYNKINDKPDLSEANDRSPTPTYYFL